MTLRNFYSRICHVCVYGHYKLRFFEYQFPLSAIRDGRLYRAEFPTFEKYLEVKWGMTGRRARMLMEATEITETISKSGTVVPLPANEAQARPLTQLDTKEEQVEAWRAANEKAKASDRPVTAKRYAVLFSWFSESLFFLH